MKSRSKKILVAVIMAACWFAGFIIPAEADDRGSVRGVLYVSYPGDLSFDVMFVGDVDVLLINADGAIERDFEALRQKFVPAARAQENAVTKAIVDVRAPSGNDKAKERRETLKSEQLKLEKLRSTYQAEINTLLAKSAVQRIKTDKKGNFKFAALAPGRYFLHARYELQGTENNYFWLYPAELKAGEEIEVNLNKANTVHLYDLPSAKKEGDR